MLCIVVSAKTTVACPPEHTLVRAAIHTLHVSLSVRHIVVSRVDQDKSVELSYTSL